MSQIENKMRHGSLPLVLGVTGHRDLRAEDVPKVKEKAEEILRQFNRDRPHTPLVVLTSLAKGAVHLVARVALELGIRIGICLAVLVTLALLFHHQLREWIDGHHEWHGLLLVLMSLPPIGAALLHGYLEKRALFEHAKQYSRMSLMFNNARERLTEMLSEGDYERARDLIKVLGKEALEESGDWVLLHRERPLEVPHA